MAKTWAESLGWPIVDTGLLMVAIDEMMFVRTNNQITESAFERHLVELARAIDERDATSRIGVVYDALEDGMDTSAKRRQRAADVLAARKEKLGKTTAGFALITSSTVMRGVLRAVFWMAPPPYPWTIAATLREGLSFIHQHKPDLDVEDVARAYERIKARHDPSGPALRDRGAAQPPRGR